MSTIKFTPQLIHRDEAAINEQNEKLEKAAFKLSNLGKAWEKQFREPFGIAEFRLLPRPDERLIDRFLKLTYIEKDPELSKIYRPGRMKPEVALRDNSIEFPDFTDLADIISSTVSWITNNISGNWLNQLYENNLVVTETMKEAIITVNTVYTVNLHQNLLLEKVRQLGELISFFSDIGYSFHPAKDFPAPFNRLLTSVRTGKKYSELKHSAGEQRYEILNWVPASAIAKKDESVYHYLGNLSDEQISEMYAKLINNK